MTPLPLAARRLVDSPSIAHLATLMPDGSPKVEPVWVGRRGDQILIATDARSIKARNVEMDGRVALSVTAEHNPYEQLLIRGIVVEVRGDDDLALLDELSRKYLGSDFARRRWSRRVILVIEPSVVRHYISSLRRPENHDPTKPGE